MSHDWSNRHWIIRSYPQPPEVWNVVLEKVATCRRSLDGTQVLLKWEGETPTILASDTVYNHAAILTLLAGPEWTPPEPPLPLI